MRVLSLFSGIGGLDLAAEWAGMEVVAQCEIDPYCQSILKRHWPHVRLFDDIRTVTADAFRVRESQPQGRESDEWGWVGNGGEETLADADLQGCHRSQVQSEQPGRAEAIWRSQIDLITGGFPCQPVSAAGKRRGEADDRWLWPEMLRVIREIQPAWVVGENVAGLISMGLDGCISDLEEAGYACQAFVIPACAVNALHRRDRVFIVAHAGHDVSRSPEAHASEQGGDGQKDGIFDGGGFVAHAADHEQSRRGTAWNGRRQSANHSGRETLSGVGDMAHGLPSWMAGGWAEPARLKEHEPGRVNKLRALGNAVVPAQAYPIFKAIMDHAA